MLKKHFINVLTTFLLFSNIFAQISANDINRLSNSQLDALREAVGSTANIDSNVDANDSQNIQTVRSDIVSIPLINPTTEDLYFGYSYFRKNINFYDNIPTPADYRLGPGDEIILSLWGETNLRESFIINKDGMIYYTNIGFINLSNKNLKEAELLLVEKFSSIYSTLKNKDDSTKLMLELGQLKSINVYFSGHIENPGINLVHPFSDIFSAIIQAGGISDRGSLRAVELIRNGKTIAIVDFYSFFMNGKNTFSSIKLIDGDVIHIPNYKNRIGISGEVNRPFIYELLPSESISDIIAYASGFNSLASSTLTLNQIIPVEERSSDDNARTSITINYKNIESVILNNGDNIVVLPITSVDSNVTIYGKVKSPGIYPGVNTTLKNILDIAGGFDDPVYRKSIREDEIAILRQDSAQFYSQEFIVAYKDADQFKLKQNDKIFVYENINYENNFTYRVEGEVFKPGTYPISKENLTVSEALALAGGLTELSSEKNITILQEYTEVNEAGFEITSSEPVNNATLDFIIGINTVIIASPIENVVNIEGNVYNPGLITYTEGYRYPRYIELAGGYMPDTLKRKAFIKRANGNIEKANGFFISRGTMVYPGDTIVVPADPDPQDFDITSFIAEISTTLANIAAILLIVDNNKN